MEGTGLFQVGKNALLPLHERAQNIMAHLTVGDKVLVKVHKARNPEHNALAHAVIAKIAQAIGKSPEVVKLWLKWECGWVDLVKMPNGKTIAAPRSLAFESMSQDEFQRWWNEALEVVKEKVLPNISKQDFEEIRAMIAGKDAA